MLRKRLGRRIYLDYASLTPIDKRVVKEMAKYSGKEYANPSSLYKEGVAAKKALASARKSVADFIHAHPDEIYFNSGGTEANNAAILGAVESLHEKGIEYADMHIVISVIEHSSVRECANYLNSKGVELSVISVNEKGIIDLDELKKSIRPNTAVVSVMLVNNEIGSVQPIRDIAKIIRQARSQNAKDSIYNFQDEVSYPLFHTDAAQAMYEELNVERLGVDMLTLDGTKMYGPRGLGVLYLKRGTPIVSIVKGGGQENGMRSGTENIPAIMGMAKALELIVKGGQKEKDRILLLRNTFVSEVKKIKQGIGINGEENQVSPHIVNVSIPDIDSEFFVIQLDAKGIACSTKSSCLRDEDESYVLQAIGARSKSSVRFSFGRFTKNSDIDKAIRVIKERLSK